MDAKRTATAQSCLSGAYDGTMDFATIVSTLIEAEFEGYDVDFRRNTATYYLAGGDSIQLSTPKTGGAIEARFQAELVEQAVREAQQNVPGYSYKGFCSKVKSAGCAGYMVSFLGTRVVYFGRTAEIHVEHFPK